MACDFEYSHLLFYVGPTWLSLYCGSCWAECFTTSVCSSITRTVYVKSKHCFSSSCWKSSLHSVVSCGARQWWSPTALIIHAWACRRCPGSWHIKDYANDPHDSWYA